MVALCIKWYSMTQPLSARDAELDRLQVRVDAKPDFLGLLNNYLEQQKTSFEKTKEALRRRLADTETLPNAIFTEMTAHRDRLREEGDRLSSNRSIVGVEL